MSHQFLFSFLTNTNISSFIFNYWLSFFTLKHILEMETSVLLTFSCLSEENAISSHKDPNSVGLFHSYLFTEGQFSTCTSVQAKAMLIGLLAPHIHAEALGLQWGLQMLGVSLVLWDTQSLLRVQTQLGYLDQGQ